MAMKLGTENKRNVIIAGALFCLLLYLVITQVFGGSSTPAPRASTPQVVTPARRTTSPQASTAEASDLEASNHEAHKLPALSLDPSLHLDKLMASEDVEYAGTGRNIFSADSAPAPIPEPMGPARPVKMPEIAQGPPQPPPPPQIDLRYFGYAAKHDGQRAAFFLHGDDVFEAFAGDIVNHRYKVVSVDLHSAQVTDLSYNNTQTIPLVSN
ncbi:hypothetical protein ACFPT7_04885 [Acidicapsa dinghuensis]|uniref:Uncharacterized protein n=1 Tax=Acidicapsa dinghuensis TaxID=2218256 RepID=A0ABW1ECR8_9BACT|nr:hypothetical protein [Acidicapsa dinghuensis]